MAVSLKEVEARISEDDCLDEVMRLRFGEAPCPACDARTGFSRARKHRAFTCRACGFSLYPCEGLPFGRAGPPLTGWFGAVHAAAADGKAGAGSLARALRISRKAAEPIAAGLEGLRTRPSADGATSWFDGIAAFVSSRLDGAAAVAEPTAAVRETEARETIWQTLGATISLPDFHRRPLLGIATIGILAGVGIGIGWLLVPAPPEEDTELAQATAILTLASDKPVIIVSQEVANQLYDVSDVDQDAASPLATSIRVAPAGGGRDSRPGDIAEAKPMTQPSVKLSSNVGKQLAQGDLSAVKASAASRPELAVYNSLARELEGGGSRDPNELLIFGPMRIRRHLVEKIVRAARVTEMDPVLLMAIADKESSFQTEVQAQTSSASGLFQFVERTWFGVVRDYGARYGLEKEVRILTGDMIPADRTRILDLRRDAYLSAVLAAEMLKHDSTRIEKRLGRNLTGGEIYLVHFLGPDGAERLLDQVMKKPDAVAADLLPKPAAANKTIFYAGSGDAGPKGLSVSEVRSKFETMISLRLDRYKTVKAPPPAAPAQAPPKRPPAR